MRRLAWIAVACAALAVVVARSSDAAVSQTINAGINQNRDLSMAFVDGTPIGAQNPPGTIIPPGTYSVAVVDDSDIANFDLNGPGVNMATAVDNWVTVTWTVTFQPCGLYSYSNDTVAGSNVWFQTSASATNLAACAGTGGGGGGGGGTTPPPAPKGGATTGNASPTKTATPKKASKPVVLPLRGGLAAAVAAGGAATLASGGKPVGSLKPGRYTLTVTDRSPKAGFVLQELKRSAIAVSGASFVGTRKVTVALSPGQWFFYPGPGGKKTYFIVVG